jgi:uncharacterized protein (TIGR00251 family)
LSSAASLPLPWQITTQGLILHVHVQPRASQNRLVGRHGGSLKIALITPPVDNAANTALLSFLAALLRIPRSSFTLLSGDKSREKRVQIVTHEQTRLTQQLEQLLAAVDKKISDG